ncbi:helix-turn-helix domain-containing protein [Nocardia jejuensis]|uniref:helix-turn-helix domain-containing protein n=1 Tax=Nocardia jejuensis TaxID=328049 RepID=UPI00082F5DA0|nr:helix-turn-helix domain-containing protein [Nocardia jejuensis]
MAKGQLAVFVRARRAALGITQAQLAASTGWSKSAIEKVEAGTLTPSLEFVGALFDALQISYVYRERIIETLYPGTLDRILGPSRDLPDAEALADLEDLPYPSAYVALPEFDVLGANTAWTGIFPQLSAGSSFFTYLFAEPASQSVLVDWEWAATAMAYVLRMLGPISLPEAAIASIVERCSVHPDFARMYSTDTVVPTEHDPHLRVADPETGQVRTFRMKIDKPHIPLSSWVTYRLVPKRDQPAS